jgi:hypothetical protein
MGTKDGGMMPLPGAGTLCRICLAPNSLLTPISRGTRVCLGCMRSDQVMMADGSVKRFCYGGKVHFFFLSTLSYVVVVKGVLEKGKGYGVRSRAEARGVCQATIRRRLTRIALESARFKPLNPASNKVFSFFATTCTSALRSGHRQMEPVDKFKGKQSRCVAALQNLKDKRAKAKAAHAITEDVDSDDLKQGGNAGQGAGGRREVVTAEQHPTLKRGAVITATRRRRRTWGAGAGSTRGSRRGMRRSSSRSNASARARWGGAVYKLMQLDL